MRVSRAGGWATWRAPQAEMLDKRTPQRAPGGQAWRTLHATARIGRPTARSTPAPGSSSRIQRQHDTRANGWRCDVREAGDRHGLPLGPDPGWGSSAAAEGGDGNQAPVGGAGDEEPARGRNTGSSRAGTSRADSRPPLATPAHAPSQNHTSACRDPALTPHRHRSPGRSFADDAAWLDLDQEVIVADR
jgi:hypothetical protein